LADGDLPRGGDCVGICRRDVDAVSLREGGLSPEVANEGFVVPLHDKTGRASAPTPITGAEGATHLADITAAQKTHCPA
jgi:hypothetical protein